MISYSPGYWSIAFIFSLEGSVLPRAFVWAVPNAITTYMCHLYFHERFDGYSSSEAGMDVFRNFTLILGFLIVFRANQAYARWWEGGTLLLQVRGEWFNAYSSLIALCSMQPEKALEVMRFQHQLMRLMSMLYGAAVMQVNTMEEPSIDVIDLHGFDQEHLKYLEECHDRVEIVLQWIQKTVVLADSSQVISAAPPILTRVYNQLGTGMAILSSARKIGEFPIPFPVAQMVTFMLHMQWIITVLIATMVVRDSWWASALAFAVTLCMWSVNYLAVELEMPFGDDPNDLPLQHLQADMNASLVSLLHPSALSPPDFQLMTDEAETYVKMQELFYKDDGTMELREKLHGTSQPILQVDKRLGMLDAVTGMLERSATPDSPSSSQQGAQMSTALARIKYARVASGRTRTFNRGMAQNRISQSPIAHSTMNKFRTVRQSVTAVQSLLRRRSPANIPEEETATHTPSDPTVELRRPSTKEVELRRPLTKEEVATPDGPRGDNGAGASTREQVICAGDSRQSRVIQEQLSQIIVELRGIRGMKSSAMHNLAL